MTLFQYLAKKILVGSLLVLLTFGGLIVLLDFAHELGKARSENLLATAFYTTLYAIPKQLYQLLPAAVATGSLLILGGLAQQSELLAARVVGYSRHWITAAALLMGSVFMIIMLLLSEALIPLSERVQSQRQAEQRLLQTATEATIWTKDGSKFINVLQSDTDEIYRDVLIYEYNLFGELERVVQADSMTLSEDNFHLQQVLNTKIDENELIQSSLEHDTIPRHFSLATPHLQTVDPQTLNGWQLISYIRFLDSSKLRADLHRLSLWKRVSQPFSIIVMLLIVMPFVFLPVRRSNTGQRLLIGIIIGLSYTIIDKGVNSFAIISMWPAWLGAFAFPITCLLASLCWQQQIQWNLRRHKD